ncbi:hypothetical protein DCAR_0414558 [Daucus carota subsp. sativus]|uniref:Uncharacterized protein n=1 Tax=Daucus carota subsp. sativus TaxID=79200 RepID=A0A175YC89_DAUCS|nr:hypothetical protein DCAR_0414558 [Daucus carota subsp. sativus]
MTYIPVQFNEDTHGLAVLGLSRTYPASLWTPLFNSSAANCRISSVFDKQVVNLDQGIWNGFKARDLLELAVIGWEARSGEGSSSSFSIHDHETHKDAVIESSILNSDLMEVAQMMVEWDEFASRSF